MALKISICMVEVSFKGRKLGGVLPDTLLSNTPECLFIGRAPPNFLCTGNRLLLCDERFKKLISIHHSIRMGTLIVMGSVHAGADQSVADIIAGLK